MSPPQVKKWTKRINVPAVISSERESKGVNLIGIEPEAEKGLSFIGDGVSSGEMLTGTEDSGIVIGEKLAELLQTRIGKRIVILTQDYNGKVADRGFRIKGLFRAELESTEKSYVFVGRKTAQKLLKLDNKISEISILSDDRENLVPLLGSLQPLLDQQVTRTWLELKPLLQAMRKIQDGFLWLWFFIVVLTVACGLVNTLFMSILKESGK